MLDWDYLEKICLYLHQNHANLVHYIEYSI